MRFHATIELGGKSATGVPVPDEVVAALGPGSRPAVLVSIGGHSYRTTVARMGGRFLVPLSADNRRAAGVAAGDDVEVEIEVDAAPREVTVPADLDAAPESGRRRAGVLRRAGVQPPQGVGALDRGCEKAGDSQHPARRHGRGPARRPPPHTLKRPISQADRATGKGAPLVVRSVVSVKVGIRR